MTKAKGREAAGGCRLDICQGKSWIQPECVEAGRFKIVHSTSIVIDSRRLQFPWMPSLAPGLMGRLLAAGVPTMHHRRSSSISMPQRSYGGDTQKKTFEKQSTEGFLLPHDRHGDWYRRLSSS